MTDLPKNSPKNSPKNNPLLEPISDIKAKKIDETIKKKIKTLTLDEVVDTDSRKMNGQNYALISIVSPHGMQKCDKLCLKIKGVFSEISEANKYAKMLQDLDSTFDIYVVEMYSWLLLPPDLNLIEQIHVDNKLHEIISSHRENQLRANAHFQERKTELMNNLAIENTKLEEQNKKIREESILETVIETETETEIEAEKEIPEQNNTTPTELMHQMTIDKIKENPSRSWADEMEEVD